MVEKILIHKLLGETPLEALERTRIEEGISDDVPMTYAGRLDPAAEGKLLILLGEECKNKDMYLGLNKTYKAEILIGISTDTYDMLGLPTVGRFEDLSEDTLLVQVQAFLQTSLGRHLQSYPPYSSKTVDGVQLHTLARAGTDVELPTHEVELYSYGDLCIDIVTGEDVLMRAAKVVGSVRGDFRQEEIAQAWQQAVLDDSKEYWLVSLTLSVSSGYYIRQLAQDLSQGLGTGACLYSLIRTALN